VYPNKQQLEMRNLFLYKKHKNWFFVIIMSRTCRKMFHQIFPKLSMFLHSTKTCSPLQAYFKIGMMTIGYNLFVMMSVLTLSYSKLPPCVCRLTSTIILYNIMHAYIIFFIVFMYQAGARPHTIACRDWSTPNVGSTSFLANYCFRTNNFLSSLFVTFWYSWQMQLSHDRSRLLDNTSYYLWLWTMYCYVGASSDKTLLNTLDWFYI